MSRRPALALLAAALACSSPTGSGGGTPPTVTLEANPTGVTTGTSSTLTWTSTNATSCTATGGWSGTLATSGSQDVSPTATTVYKLTCTGAGGSASDSAIVTFSASPPPVVSLTATPDTILRGQSSTLAWTSSNDSLCTASGSWSGTQATNGTHGVSPTSTATYTLTCSGVGGDTRRSVTVVVVLPAPPTVSILAQPTSISSGQSSTLTWTSSNDTLCTASGGWTGPQPLNGNTSVSPTSTTVYTLTCAGAGGSKSMSATVTVTGTSTGYVYPLKVSGRSLVDQNGKPFLYMGDAAWSLIAQLPDSDAETYFANRASHGFTVAMINVIEHKFATNAPNNIYNQAPFTGAVFTTPNPAYFAHMDAVVQSALNHKMVVQLDALYLGSGCMDEGWAAEVASASASALQTWGAYLGNRYASYPNIIWQVGGDADPTICLNALTNLQAMVTGIQSADRNHPFITHNNAEQTDQEAWGTTSWLSLHSVYTYSTTLYSLVASEVTSSPTLPTVLIETAYENESTYNGSQSPTGQQLRAQIYWTILEGGIGNVFGDCPIWNFDTPQHSAYCPETGWKTYLDSQGALNMQYAQALFNSRHWSKLVPDASHAAVTAGLSSGTNYVTAAYTSDSSSIVAYLPASTTLTANGSKLSGTTMTAWWYNPATGQATQYTTGGPFSTSGSYQFIPPAGTDWVLILDSSNFGFGTPGS